VVVGGVKELFDAVVGRWRGERLGRRFVLVGPLVALRVAVLPRRALDVRRLQVALGVVPVHLDGVRVRRPLHHRPVGLYATFYRLHHPAGRTKAAQWHTKRGKAKE